MATDDMLNAGETPSESEPASKSDWPDVHTRAMEEYARDFEHDRTNIEEAYSDLAFRRGEIADQWDATALKAREGRPTHVINEIPQFVRQITGDMRQAKPGIKVIPVDSKGDPKVAERIAGMVRYVENRSHAQSVYTQAADSQVVCGIGHWRVLTEYASSTTFNQEIRIGSISDGVAVVWDADAILPTREDAMRCFVPVDMSLAKFKSSWPDAKSDGFEIRSGATFQNWHGDDFIRVAEYWVKKPIKRLLALGDDGSVEDLTELATGLDAKGKKAEVAKLRAAGIRAEWRDSFKVVQYIITSAEVLEENEWPGLHIPIVPVIGEEVTIGRSVYRHGIVRYAKEPQRMLNYYASAETEVIALQPKAPWIGTKKMFEKNYDTWETANTENHPFLEFTPDTSMPGGMPQRVAPPVASQAIQLGKQQASEKLRAVIGIYDASLGARSNETSGVAIGRRDAQADTGTFVYHANFGLSIQRTSQIIVDLLPHTYDTQRTMRIIGDDGKPDLITINQKVMEDGREVVKNDLTVGSYDVMTVAGPSYATRREEASAGLTEFIRAFPASAPVLGDVYAKMQDWPDADKIGERLEVLLPPPIQAQLKKERHDPDTPPEPPTPEEQQAAKAAQMQEAAAQLELQGKKLDNDKKQAEIVKIMRDAGGQGEQPEQPDPMQMARDEIELAEKQDELATKREINAINVQIKLAELEKARLGLQAAQQQHALGIAKAHQNIEHADDKHGMGMHAQAEQSRRTDEQHRVSLGAE